VFDMSTIRSRFVIATVCSVLLAYLSGVIFTLLCQRPMHFTDIVHLLIIGVCVMIMAALVGYLLSQPIRRRLYEIEEAAVLMADGRLKHRITGIGERDEIDQLAIQFNRMGERLENQVGLLQSLAEENVHLTESAERAATMEERQRLARELHDSVSQQLFSLTMLAAAAKNQCSVQSNKLPITIQHMEELANQAQREMRGLLLHLRPVLLDGRSFAEAASAFLQAVTERHGLACTFRCHEVSQLPSAIEEQLFRILQEAVANVLKHAYATSVNVQLSELNARYELTVSDDGRGFTEQPPGNDTLGLTAMRERASRLGGRLEILPRAPGMTIRVVIPRASQGKE
jgi:two-component system, NarL family, sensor histidine kinase LiaS